MPSRAYTSFLRRRSIWFGQDQSPCQCPLGLIPHFYANDPDGWDMLEDDVSMPSRAYTSFLHNDVIEKLVDEYLQCQCPLGLIPHFYHDIAMSEGYAAYKCQCPLGLIPHFY